MTMKHTTKKKITTEHAAMFEERDIINALKKAVEAQYGGSSLMPDGTEIKIELRCNNEKFSAVAIWETNT